MTQRSSALWIWSANALLVGIVVCVVLADSQDGVHDPDREPDPVAVIQNVNAVGGGVAVGDAAAGYNHVTLNNLDYSRDDAGHSIVRTNEIVGTTTYRWLRLPAGTAAGDAILWDGTKWTAATTQWVTDVVDVRYDPTAHKVQVKTEQHLVLKRRNASGWTDVATPSAGRGAK